jgi:hypothetical protein
MTRKQEIRELLQRLGPAGDRQLGATSWCISHALELMEANGFQDTLWQASRDALDYAQGYLAGKGGCEECISAALLTTPDSMLPGFGQGQVSYLFNKAAHCLVEAVLRDVNEEYVLDELTDAIDAACSCGNLAQGLVNYEANGPESRWQIEYLTDLAETAMAMAGQQTDTQRDRISLLAK